MHVLFCSLSLTYTCVHQLFALLIILEANINVNKTICRDPRVYYNHFDFELPSGKDAMGSQDRYRCYSCLIKQSLVIKDVAALKHFLLE